MRSDGMRRRNEPEDTDGRYSRPENIILYPRHLGRCRVWEILARDAGSVLELSAAVDAAGHERPVLYAAPPTDPDPAPWGLDDAWHWAPGEEAYLEDLGVSVAHTYLAASLSGEDGGRGMLLLPESGRWWHVANGPGLTRVLVRAAARRVGLSCWSGW